MKTCLLSIALILLLLIAAACGNGSPAAEVPTPTATETITETPTQIPTKTPTLKSETPTPEPIAEIEPTVEAPTTEHELDTILAQAKSRIQIDPTWAWAPDRNDQDRFPYFEKHNESRWNLELDPSKIEPGTIYEQTVPTEEGGVVSEYLVFDQGKVTWWFDGRGDQYSEFESPSVRKKKVMKLFLAVHDGKSGWDPIDKSKEMPLDHGLSVGIILVDGSQRFW